MELRKSVREKNAKKTVVLSDEEEEEEVLTKKTKLTAKGAHLKNDQLSNENYGVGKRVRRKNGMFKNYKLTDDSDSDFDAGPLEVKHAKSRKKRGSKIRESTRIEFLLDWKREITISSLPTVDTSYKVVNTKKIVDADLKQYGSDLQALFINIRWRIGNSHEGVKIDDFKKLDLNKKLIRNGIVFIWSEKEILGRLVKIMEEKGFFYIENFVIALLDSNKAHVAPKTTEQEVKQPKINSNKSSPVPPLTNKTASSNCSDTSSTTESTKHCKIFQEEDNDTEFLLQNLEKYPNLEAEQLLNEGEAEFLKISKKVLMMFRKTDSKEANLELRHQRTCDALFDLIDGKSPYATDLRTKEYVYRMIETLLPKACYNPEDSSLKMMELLGGGTLQDQEKDGLIFVKRTRTIYLLIETSTWENIQTTREEN